MSLERLDWDTQHLGYPVARLVTDSLAEVEEGLERCRQEGVRLLIARCHTGSYPVVHALEAHGAQLMQTDVFWQMRVPEHPPPLLGDAVFRPHRPEDVEEIRHVATEAFRGQIDHFHCDPRISRERADEVYVQWAVNSCSQRELADEVYVALLNDRVVGFGALRQRSAVMGEMTLGAVSADVQGHHVYHDMVSTTIEWCRQRQLRVVHIETQINNLAVQHAWARHGMRLAESLYTFHQWFD
ncbi:MAG: GNAT family N-acetyltransferase [Chloroflexi bacterium]|nr:GNAT family N-acetyltransferase [Chloroflexota bacterium]